ncbi:MAG: hypothetical protein OHK0029_36690 [Armatimonadaceae bacterium]
MDPNNSIVRGFLAFVGLIFIVTGLLDVMNGVPFGDGKRSTGIDGWYSVALGAALAIGPSLDHYFGNE